MDNNSQLALLLLAIVAVLVFVLRRGQSRDAGRGHPASRRSGSARSPVPAFREASAAVKGAHGGDLAQPSAAGPVTQAVAAVVITPRPPLQALLDFELVRTDALSTLAQNSLQLLLRGRKQPNPLLARISSGLDEPDELGRLVRSDPGLSAEVLRTVNSAAFSLRNPITSVNHALTFLGSNLVKSVVTHAAVAPSLQLDTEAQRSAVDRLWRASYLASTLAQLAGHELGLPRPSVLATEALLSSLGDIALISRRPELADCYLSQSSLLEQLRAQQAACGLNGAVVAAALARQWQLPEELALTLQDLLLPLVCPPDSLPVVGEARRQLLICYTACRLGWWLLSTGEQDLGNVELWALETPDFHYLPEHLQAAGLEDMLRLCTQPALRNKINPLLAQLVTPENAQ